MTTAPLRERRWVGYLVWDGTGVFFVDQAAAYKFATKRRANVFVVDTLDPDFKRQWTTPEANEKPPDEREA